MDLAEGEMTRKMDLDGKAARLAGLMYLGTIGFGLYAEIGVRRALIRRDDPTATAQAIFDHLSTFRIGLVADLMMLVCYVAVAALFYGLFRDVSRRVSVTAAAFSMIGIASLATACLLLLFPVRMADLGLPLETVAAMMMVVIRVHGDGYNISLVFFGIYCLLLAWLIWRSTFVPKIIGALMAIAGLCYLVNSLARLGWPDIAAMLPAEIMYPTLLGELALALWLAVFGKGRAKASAPPP